MFYKHTQLRKLRQTPPVDWTTYRYIFLPNYIFVSATVVEAFVSTWNLIKWTTHDWPLAFLQSDVLPLTSKILVKYLFFFLNPFWLQYFIGVCMNHFSHDKKFCKVLTSTLIQFFACVIISNWLFFFLSEAQHWLHVFWSHFGNQLFIVFWFITVLPLFCLSLGVHHVVWLPRPLKWLLVTFTEFTGSRLSRNPSSGKVWLGFLPHPISYSPSSLPYNSSVWRFWYWIN